MYKFIELRYIFVIFNVIFENKVDFKMFVYSFMIFVVLFLKW